MRGGASREGSTIRRGGSHNFRSNRPSSRRHYNSERRNRARRIDRSRRSISRRRVRDHRIYERRVYTPRRTSRRLHDRKIRRFDKRRSVSRIPHRNRKWKRSRHRSRKFRHYHSGWYYDYPWWLYVSALPYYDYDYNDDAHIAWCFAHYGSYDPRTNTFLGYDGNRHECISPYSY